MARTFSHLTWDDRIRIETLHKQGVPVCEIAETVGKHISSIYLELARGQVQQLNSDLTMVMRYSPELADKRYRDHLKAKGPDLKLGNDPEFIAYIEDKIINEQCSPQAALLAIKREGKVFETTICINTLYSYIIKGVFPNLSIKNLRIKSTRLKRKHTISTNRSRPARGESIEKRPEEVNKRETFGHWEGDTVEGPKDGEGKVLLVLTERLTRQEIIIPMASQTAQCTVDAFDILELQWGSWFKKCFQSITLDNGKEFSDYLGIEKSIYATVNKTEATEADKRIKIYVCHPQSSWERGSNENQNRLIRYHIPKSTPIENYSHADIKKIETWVNNYPRHMFGGESSVDRFAKELFKLGIPPGEFAQLGVISTVPLPTAA